MAKSDTRAELALLRRLVKFCEELPEKERRGYLARTFEYLKDRYVLHPREEGRTDAEK